MSRVFFCYDCSCHTRRSAVDTARGEIDSGNGIRSTISGFVVFASENSKAGRLRSDVSLAADIKCIVPLLDVLQDRINGFIHELAVVSGMAEPDWWRAGKQAARRAGGVNADRHGGGEHDWIHP